MVASTDILDQITQEFLNVFKHDESIIQSAAKNLFYYLVIIQLALSAIWMTLAGESLQRFLTRMVQLAFSFGFFYALIQFGGEWVPNILNGFISLGQQGGVSSLDPSSVINQGVSISGAIFKGFFGWGLLGHPFVSLIGAAVCVGVIVLYALIAAELTIVLVKSYVIVAMGGLFFAFGASDYTREMSKNYFKTAIGLGLNLMVLYLLLGVGQNIGAQWADLTNSAAQNHEMMPMLVIAGAVIVYYLIIKNIPAFIAGLAGVGGFRNYGDAAVGAAVNAGMTSANTLMRAKAMMGKGVYGATQTGLAGASVFKSAAQGFNQGSGGIHNVGSAIKNAGSKIGSAGANTIKDVATRNNQHLSAGQKFANHLAKKCQYDSGSSPKGPGKK